MRPIQVLLALVIISSGIFFYGRMRSRLLDRSLFLVLIGLGIVMTVFPDLTRVVAHILRVGRGVDLVIYLGLVGLAFLWMTLYSRLRELEQQLTDLSRTIAIAQAHKPRAPADKGASRTEQESTEGESNR